MARIDFDDSLKAAQRFADNLRQQQTNKDERRDAEMLNSRRDFMLANDRVFFESIIDGSDILPLRYFEIGQLAARSVGRIHLSTLDGHGDGFATGFLVAPNLLLTNKHVFPTRDWAAAATLTMDAQDGIDGLPLVPRIFQFDPDRLYICNEDLDFCFVAVASKAIDGTLLENFGYLRLLETTGKIVRDEYATIIQHPNGRQKHIASRNNKITVYVYDSAVNEGVTIDNNYLYYSTDTLRGSSGSPVLNDQWYVVALHRRGVPKTQIRKGKRLVMRKNGRPAAKDDPDEVISYISNEGVRISRILKKLDILATSGTDDEMRHASAARRIIKQTSGPNANSPLSVFTRSISALTETKATGEIKSVSGLEVISRKLSLFPENAGYRPDFLNGTLLPLPKLSDALMQFAAHRIDKPQEITLPFGHFTTVMHAQRRLPIFAAVNISGSEMPLGAMPTRPPWSYDPRIDRDHQPDDSIFSSMLQRGHLAARNYVYWGATPSEISQADVHSFTLTNVCPQIARFNGNKEWYEIERLVAKGAELNKLRITEMLGPIFGDNDPDYDSLRGPKSKATTGTGIRLPLRFWKIVAWVENQQLKYRALILDQSDELDAAGQLEFDIETIKGVTMSTIEEISALSGLTFDGFINNV